MDLLKLFALLVAVATVRISAEGPKKKIRIHLPQKVKHIHHHKKIYITNHPAASQYAPAYMPSAESAMAVPTRMAIPAVAGLLPVNSVEMFEEPSRRPSIVTAGSKLLPLYHARDYYGTGPSEWDDQEYDLSPPPEPTDHSYVPTGPSGVTAPLTNYHKKVKIIKLNDPPRKKGVRKGKPNKPSVRGKPQLDEEIPVSTFHEQFYSDLDGGSATLKKVKKPQRVEKIIDGDTEHIHTYSEEHIHKLVYDDGTSKLLDGNPVGSMSTLSAPHPIFPMKNSLLALSPGAMGAFASMGTMGAPSHLDYGTYNPHEVTHDHVFHDHGEIPADTDVSKENLPYPPRVSYNSQGMQIGSLEPKIPKSSFPLHSYHKTSRPTVANDYSYYENMFPSHGRPRLPRPMSSTFFPATTESAIDYDYGPFPSLKLRDKGQIKTRKVLPQLPGQYFGSKLGPDYRTQQTSAPAPFAVSSTIVHDYKPNNYASQTSALGYNKHRDPLQNFKDDSYSNNFDFDSYASASSNLNAPENKLETPSYTRHHHSKRGKKKSISTQNIRIGSLDHQTTVDHLGGAGLSMSLNDGAQSAYDQTKAMIDSASSTPFTIRESSWMHPYYSAMAAKALQGDQLQVAESSNNFQYVEAPSTTEFAPVATTSIPPASLFDYFDQEGTDPIPTAMSESNEYVIETRPKHRSKDTKPSASSVLKDTRQRHSYGTESSGAGSRKYGDKI